MKNQPATKLYSHRDLVNLAEKWLKNQKRCKVILTEFACCGREIPDAVGFQYRGSSFLIECKITKSDFLADMKKPFRVSQEDGIGARRYYMVPEGLVERKDVPKNWGLIYVSPTGFVRAVKESTIIRQSVNALKNEEFMLLSTIRRLRGEFGEDKVAHILKCLPHDNSPVPPLSTPYTNSFDENRRVVRCCR